MLWYRNAVYRDGNGSLCCFHGYGHGESMCQSQYEDIDGCAFDLWHCWIVAGGDFGVLEKNKCLCVGLGWSTHKQSTCIFCSS